MSYEILIPKKVEKFINSLQNHESIKEKLKLLKGFKSSQKLNLDIKSMKGEWRGYYRLRIGDVRFIFKIIENKIIFIEEADYRGKVY
jgi:mRNA interferase RelE/StbE